MSADTLELNAPRFSVNCDGGSDVTFTLKLPFDATAGTHRLLFSLTADGVSIAAYGVGSGLTVGAFASGITPVSVTIPRAFTLTHQKKTIFFSYHLTMSGIKRGYGRGKFVIGGDIYE